MTNTEPQPEPRLPKDDRARALAHAGAEVAKWRKAEESAHVAIRFARDAGASLREIEAATGVPFKTVDRICSAEADQGEE